jgi:hypothetical protein
MTTRRRSGWHWRFYRRVRIIPGVFSIVLSRSGISPQIGPRWAHRTFGRTGITDYIDTPGPGYVQSRHARHHVRAQRHGCAALLLLVIGASVVATMALRHAVTLQGVLMVLGCYLGMHWSWRRRESARGEEY